MFYNKKYPENKDKVLLSDIDREDRIEEGFNNVKKEFDEIDNRFDDIADYPIEIGSNSNGTYELWKSGKIIQRGWVSLQGRNQQNPLNVQLPRNVISANYINAQLTRKVDTVGDNAGVTLVVNDAQIKEGTFRVFHDSSTSLAVGAYWELVGRWK